MQFFIHKPQRSKPGIEGSRCVIRNLQGDLVECIYENYTFTTLDGCGSYHIDYILWWCYKDSLIVHLELEE